MPPALALFLTLLFVGFLLRRDLRQNANVTPALWLPVIWMFFSGSRPATQWLQIAGLNVSGAVSLEEGSPLDAVVFCLLIVSAFVVVWRRRVSVATLILNNRALAIYFIYCFVAIFWSDFPEVAIKRWIKILGHPIMVMVLFTEPDPEEAISRLMKRCSYLLIPMSVTFIKYFPQYGRTFSPWSGEASNLGVTISKNALGYLCLVFGLFYGWHFLKAYDAKRDPGRRMELVYTAGMIYLTAWLMLKAHSATSGLCLVLGAATVVLLRFPVIARNLHGGYVLVLFVGLGVAEMTFDVFENMAELTGHNSTIIGRSELWQELIHMGTNPVVGVGFESFWLGGRLEKLWDEHWWHPTEAHNGYLETYLNLGSIGVFLLLCVIVSTFRTCRRSLSTNLRWGSFRMAFLGAMVAYNFTEAAFKGVSFMLFVFYIIALEYPRPASASDLREAIDVEFDDGIEEQEAVGVGGPFRGPRGQGSLANN